MRMNRYKFDCAPEFVSAVNGEWLPVEGVKFDFDPATGSVEITMTTNLHNARVMDNFWEPNGGEQLTFFGRPS